MLVILTINSGTFLFALDNTIVADIQAAIVKSFGAETVTKVPWLANAFALAAASFLLPWGKIYATFNAKWLYIASVIIFEAGSALCGGAPNMDALIVGRAIAGLGIQNLDYRANTRCDWYLHWSNGDHRHEHHR